MTNTSGITGVYWSSGKGKWVTEIVFKGKKKCIGTFDNKKRAIKARKQAEIEIFGKYLSEIDK